MEGVSQDAMLFNESMLHDLNMGYYNLETMTPHSSVGYFEAENKFYHPWSISSAGKEYGYAKLKELIPLRDFLTLPNVIVEEMLSGIMEGERERFDDDRRNKPSENPDKSLGGLTKQQIKLLQQAGLWK